MQPELVLEGMAALDGHVVCPINPGAVGAEQEG